MGTASPRAAHGNSTHRFPRRWWSWTPRGAFYVNPRAAEFWEGRLEDVAGQILWDITPGAGRRHRDRSWVRSVLMPAVDGGHALRTSSIDALGHAHEAVVSGTWLAQGEQRFAVLTFAGEGIGPEVVSEPAWALRDPLTGLHNALHWHQQVRLWANRSGAVAFFDLDGLNEINDLSGHSAGDRALALCGRALAAEAPPGALLVRYGGDAFVLVVGDGDAANLADIARRVVRRAGEEARAAGLLPLELRFGVAAFATGGLLRAVNEADDAMYEQKGVLLRARGAQRIVLTRAARGLLRLPGEDQEMDGPGHFAARFSSEFDQYFRQAYARAVEQAQEFVVFADPQPGDAVVEVAAGSGRISFDGGLAQRVTREGQPLLTDPSPAQLRVARRRAQELGYDWVRFLQAPVEELPVASSTVGLVIGSTFLHFTDPAVALRAMARPASPARWGWCASSCVARRTRSPRPSSRCSKPGCASASVTPTSTGV